MEKVKIDSDKSQPVFHHNKYIRLSSHVSILAKTASFTEFRKDLVVFSLGQFAVRTQSSVQQYFQLTSLDWTECNGSELESEKEEEDDPPQSQGVLVVDP